MLKEKKGPFNATVLRDTWSKGKSFFFVDKGDYIKVHSLSENGKYAYVEVEG